MVMVAPLAGAWIEISGYCKTPHFRQVAPLAGAWIEIASYCTVYYIAMSLPLRERGLK